MQSNGCHLSICWCIHMCSACRSVVTCQRQHLSGIRRTRSLLPLQVFHEIWLPPRRPTRPQHFRQRGRHLRHVFVVHQLHKERHRPRRSSGSRKDVHLQKVVPVPQLDRDQHQGGLPCADLSAYLLAFRENTKLALFVYFRSTIWETIGAKSSPSTRGTTSSVPTTKKAMRCGRGSATRGSSTYCTGWSTKTER